MKQAPQPFLRLLNRLRRRRQAGLLLVAGARLGGAAAVTLAGLLLLDRLLAPESHLRLFLLLAAGLVLAWRFGRDVGEALRVTPGAAARSADRALGSRRGEVLTACELGRTAEAAPGTEQPRDLAAFLNARAMDAGAAALARVRWADGLPLAELARAARTGGLLLLAAGLAAAPLGGPALRTGLLRVCFPYRDVPPYSAAVFTVLPADPQVRFGGTTELAVTISGIPVEPPVWLHTRGGGTEQRTACFQETATRFAQRLENVVQPVEFCFSMGRVRSRWHRVTVLLQPKILSAQIQLQPPAYSRLPATAFAVGEAELAGLRQSRVRLTITSNRPLQEGTLTIRGANGREQTVQAEKTPGRQNAMSFSWELLAPAELELRVRDAQGIAAAEPLKWRQRLLADAPPTVTLTDPPALALVTPGSTVSFHGVVDDDLGVTRVQLVRALSGFADRVKVVGPEQAGGKHAEFADRLDLAALGVRPGQVLECYLEAFDTNPSLLGSGASDIVRLQVISEQTYAQMLRERTTLEEFQARFQVAAKAVADARAAVGALREALAGNVPAAEREAKRAAARETVRAVAGLMRRLSADFAAYELELPLREEAAGMAGELDAGEKMLAGLDPAAAGALPDVQKLWERLGGRESRVNRQKQDAAAVVAVGRVMEQAKAFRLIVGRQETLVRRLERFGGSQNVKDPQLLKMLADQQNENLAALQELVTALPETVQSLPPEFADLKQEIVEFAVALDQARVPPVMTTAATAMEQADGRRGHRDAQLALERLKDLLARQERNGFGGMCQGRGRLFPGTKPSLAKTLAQMMGALGMGNGQSPEGGGEGRDGANETGIGGDPQDGYSMERSSMMGLPVYGPERSRFDPAANAAPGPLRKPPAGGVMCIVDAEGKTVSCKVETSAKPAETGSEIPEKYREALKRYFSREGDHP